MNFSSDSYKVFRPLFHPIICSVHSAPDESLQPEPNWTDPDHLMCQDLDQVDYVSVSVCRNISGFPFTSTMSKELFVDVEKLMRKVRNIFLTKIDKEGQNNF